MLARSEDSYLNLNIMVITSIIYTIPFIYNYPHSPSLKTFLSTSDEVTFLLTPVLNCWSMFDCQTEGGDDAVEG